MELLLRTAAIYALLLILFRVLPRRTLGELSTFDLVLLLIVSEAAQNALVGEDHSVTGAFAVILTLVLLDLLLSLVKRRSRRVERFIEGAPLVLVDRGTPLPECMKKSFVTEDDILQAARQNGLARMDQIRYAVLEVNGAISIVPEEKG